jgi:dihydrofolate reductase
VARERWREDEIAGDLVLWGSLSLTYSLWQAGVVDLVRLVMLPVVLGSGRGVFPAGSRTSQLRLIGSEALGGLLAVDYAVESTDL